MKENLQKPFSFRTFRGIICLQTKAFAGTDWTVQEEEISMALFVFFVLMFVLLLVDDHHRQMALESSWAEYKDIEYRRCYPTSN